MEFRDGKDRNPEDFVLIVKTRKEVDKEEAKTKQRFTLSRELAQIDRKCFCKIKIKDLLTNEAFFKENEVYMSYRTK